MEDFYKFKDYRSVLQKYIKSSRSQHGYKSTLAQAAGCQASYLSQVLAGVCHLTPEHAANLIDFWQLSSLEGDYFFNLVLLDRAGNQKLQLRIEKKLREIKSEAEKANANFFKIQEQEQRHAIKYYSSWIYSAVHTLVSIPQLQNIPSLAKFLRLSETELSQILNSLIAMGLVVRNGATYCLSKKNLHAGKNSEFANMHHKNWRNKIMHALDRHEESNYNYTSVYTLSQKDLFVIQELLSETVKEVRKIIDPSPEEIGACLAIDWIKL